jgi:hypothetical protein
VTVEVTLPANLSVLQATNLWGAVKQGLNRWGREAGDKHPPNPDSPLVWQRFPADHKQPQIGYLISVDETKTSQLSRFPQIYQDTRELLRGTLDTHRASVDEWKKVTYSSGGKDGSLELLWGGRKAAKKTLTTKRYGANRSAAARRQQRKK